MLDDVEKCLVSVDFMATANLDIARRQLRKIEMAAKRGAFSPTKATGYNRKQRFALAVKACHEGRDELLAAGCDLLEARKEAVNPRRRSVKKMLAEVWRNNAELKRLKEKQREAATG